MFVKLAFLSFFLFLSIVAANAQRTINGIRVGIVNGRATYLPKPDYPPEAKDFCADGKVEVLISISENGDVTEAKAISGDELLRAASVEAVKKAKFAPVMDFPVKTQGIIVYNFDSFAKCINAGIVNKKALKIPKPNVNPSPPKKESLIVIQIIIDTNGKVIKSKAFAGHPLLRAVCEKAARQAEFSPLALNITPINIKALLAYKFKPDGTIETDIEKDDKTVIGTPINLVEPPPPFCNCRFGGKISSVMVEAKTDEQGNVTGAKAWFGHPILKKICEKTALDSKFLPTNTKAKITIIYHFEATDKIASDVRLKIIEIKEVMIEK